MVSQESNEHTSRAVLTAEGFSKFTTDVPSEPLKSIFWILFRFLSFRAAAMYTIGIYLRSAETESREWSALSQQITIDQHTLT